MGIEVNVKTVSFHSTDKQGYLPQTDRASTFEIDLVQFSLASSLIIWIIIIIIIIIITITSPKCRLPGGLFSNAEVLNLNICIGIQKQTDVVDFYLSVTCFQFQFPLSVCFCTMPDTTELQTSILRLEPVVKQLSSQHTS